MNITCLIKASPKPASKIVEISREICVASWCELNNVAIAQNCFFKVMNVTCVIKASHKKCPKVVKQGREIRVAKWKICHRSLEQSHTLGQIGHIIAHVC